MGLRDKLRTRSVERADLPAPAPTAGEGLTLWEAVYGRPDPSKLRRASTYTFLEGAEAEAALAKPLTDSQRDGVRAQAQAEGLTPHPGDAVSAAADDVLARADRVLRQQRGE